MPSRRTVVASLPCLALLACATEPPPAPLPVRPPIDLPVARVEIVDQRTPLSEANFIDEARGNQLAGELSRHLDMRLQATGGSGEARAIIERASLTERLRTGRRGGVLGVVTAEPTHDLRGEITVRIVILDAAGREASFARASAARERSIGAGASVVERDAATRSLMRDLLAQFDPALDQAVRDNLGAPAGS